MARMWVGKRTLRIDGSGAYDHITLEGQGDHLEVRGHVWDGTLLLNPSQMLQVEKWLAAQREKISEW